jgi:anhydro-N-acetylmuramic acid kinase
MNRWVRRKTKINEVIVSGGGAHNPLVMAQLIAALRGIRVSASGQLGVPEDAKEAFAFALLAWETLHRRPSNVPRATGARGPVILGKICYAPPT